VTTLVVGAPVRGSWWGHPENELIYDTLVRLEPETARVKLVNEKVTLVHRRLWPALVAIGQSRAPWQLRGLSAASRKILDQVERPIRADELDVEVSGKALHDLIGELERKLIVHGYDLHTERGFHVRVLEPWSTWQREHGLDEELPPPAAATAAFERAIEGWPKVRLPWS
jgi:hypothetical protein